MCCRSNTYAQSNGNKTFTNPIKLKWRALSQTWLCQTIVLPNWQTYWFYQYRCKLGMIWYCNHILIPPNRGEILFVKNAKSYNAKYQYQIPSATHPSPFRCMIVAIGLTWQHEALINLLMPCWDAPRAGCSKALPLIADSLSALHGFESGLGHVRKVPVVFPGYYLFINSWLVRL